MATKLSNVIGAPFQDFVITQLYTRAARNSTINRTNDEVLFLANKTSWARFVSSVDIELNASQLKKFYESLKVGPIADNPKALARDWILEAGTSIQSGNGIDLRQGVGINGAYGLGGTEELGYRPIPGLTSVTIETAGRLGSLRMATVNFKVWNMNQLNVIEALYFRLGYSMLLEWGHTQYYKNNASAGEFITSGIYGIEDPFATGTRKEAIQQNIARKARATSGNYDGMLGIVSNFNWSFNQDGGYDCNVKLVGLGAVMDSLRLNQAYKLPEGLLQEYKKAQNVTNAFLEIEKLKKEKEALADALTNANAQKGTDLPAEPPKNITELYEYAQNKNIDDYRGTFGEFTSSYAYYPAPAKDPTKDEPTLRAGIPDYYYASTAPDETERNRNNAKYFGLFLQGNGGYWGRLPLNSEFKLNITQVNDSVKYSLDYQIPKRNDPYYQALQVTGYSYLGSYFYVESGKYGAPFTRTRPLTEFYNEGAFTFEYTRLVGPTGDVQSKGFYTTVSFTNTESKRYNVTRQQVLDAFNSWATSGDARLTFDKAESDRNIRLLGKVAASLYVEASTKIYIPNATSNGFERQGDPTKTVEVLFKFRFNNTNYVNPFDAKALSKDETKPKAGSSAASGDAGGAFNQPTDEQVDAASGFESALHAMLTFIKGIAQAGSTRVSNNVVPINIYNETNKFYRDGVLQDVLTTPTTVSLNPNGVPFEITKYGQKGFSSNLMVDGAERAEGGPSLFDLTPNVNFKKLCTAVVVKYNYGSDDLNQAVLSYPIYIPLGYLLAFLNNMCLIYDSIQSATPASNTSGKDKRPYIYIDFNPETNFCLTSPQQLSVDPKICLIPVNETNLEYKAMFPLEIAEALKDKLFKPTSQNELSKALVDAGLGFKTTNPYQGKTMNILLSIDYLLELANRFTASDREHSVNLKPFLEQIMEDVSKCLGNINLFRIAYRDDSNTVQIQDDQWVPSLGSDPSVINKNQYISNQFISSVHLGQLPVFGKQSLARQFQFKTNVSTKLGSMIAISAQAQTGSVNAKDHSDLSYLNKNFTDRYKPYIQDPSNGPTGLSKKQNNKAGEENNDLKIAEEFNNHVIDIYSNFKMNLERIGPAKNYLIERLSKVKSEDPITSAAPFIPADLEITLDGISGIIMGNAFTIPEDRLPLSLRGENGKTKVAFIVTGLTHTVENNQWLTKIKGQMIKIREEFKYNATTIIEGIQSQIIRNIGAVNLGSLNFNEEWVSIAFNYITKKEGFTARPQFDYTRLRAGYGSDIFVKADGQILDVISSTVFTQADAERTLRYSITDRLKKGVINEIGQVKWDTLNSRQKAALVSYTYNAGAGALKIWGIKHALEINASSAQVAALIEKGPITAKDIRTGVREVLDGLIIRRREEAKLYLS
jgi:GH24 family phage-related lysozyme (muramidase)